MTRTPSSLCSYSRRRARATAADRVSLGPDMFSCHMSLHSSRCLSRSQPVCHCNGTRLAAVRWVYTISGAEARAPTGDIFVNCGRPLLVRRQGQNGQRGGRGVQGRGQRLSRQARASKRRPRGKTVPTCRAQRRAIATDGFRALRPASSQMADNTLEVKSAVEVRQSVDQGANYPVCAV